MRRFEGTNAERDGNAAATARGVRGVTSCVRGSHSRIASARGRGTRQVSSVNSARLDISLTSCDTLACGSSSRTATRFPARARVSATRKLSVVLPVPPF